ncbi:hypothetical protein [Longimicrobium sp.]|uniref:hypothetical protein n=1 Tax=Longimicrobium sp. TaxID=2029185 RepID=UPI003B3A766E
MRTLSLRRAVMVAALAPLAACGADEPRSASAPTAAQEQASAPPTVTAVVQPQQLTLTPMGAGDRPVGPVQEVTVQPVVAGERLDLQPVTR